MWHISNNRVGCVERLLQEMRMLAAVNLQENIYGYSPLHYTFRYYGGTETTRAHITKLLLLAGADPHIRNEQGRTPLQLLLHNFSYDQATKHLLQEALADGGRTFLLHKARHLSDAAHTLTTTLAKTAPSTLHSRMLPPLPRIELASVTQPQSPPPQPDSNEATQEDEKKKERQAAVLRYVLRLEGGEQKGGTGTAGGSTGASGGSNGGGMASEVFYELLKMMGPSWYPVKEGAGSDGRV
jgi:hypothetical protein